MALRSRLCFCAFDRIVVALTLVANKTAEPEITPYLVTRNKPFDQGVDIFYCEI